MIKDAFDRWWEWVEKPPDRRATMTALRGARDIIKRNRLLEKERPFEPLFFRFYGQVCRRPS